MISVTDFFKDISKYLSSGDADIEDSESEIPNLCDVVGGLQTLPLQDAIKWLHEAMDKCPGDDEFWYLDLVVERVGYDSKGTGYAATDNEPIFLRMALLSLVLSGDARSGDRNLAWSSVVDALDARNIKC